MTYRISKEAPDGHHFEWAVRHTNMDGKWSVTELSDKNYGNASCCAEEVFDGKHWRPISDVQITETPTSNGWVKREFSLTRGDSKP